MDRRRRRVVQACGTAILGLAGCLGESASPGTEPTPTIRTPTDEHDTASGTPPGGSTTSPGEPPTDDRTPAGPRRARWHVPTALTPQRPLVVDGTCFLGTGRYEEESAEAELLAIERDGTERWRTGLDQRTADVVAVRDGMVYAISGERDSIGLHGKDYRVHAFDTESGTEQWVWPPEKSYKFFEFVGLRDGTVFVGTHDDALQDSGEAVHAVADGESRWRYGTGDVMGGTVVGDTVAATDPGGVTALAAGDGTKRWTFEGGDYGRVNAEGFQDLVLAGDRTLHALDAVDGAERWTYGDGHVSTWVTEGGRAFVGGSVVAALDTGGTAHWTYEKGGIPTGVGPDEVLVGQAERALFVLDRATGAERWRVETETEYPSPGGIAAGRLAYGTRESGIVTVDLETGESAWSWNTSAGLTEPVAAGDTFVIGRVGGGLWGLEP